MQTLAKTAVALSFIGATAVIGTTTAVQAQYGYYPHPYYYHPIIDTTRTTVITAAGHGTAVHRAGRGRAATVRPIRVRVAQAFHVEHAFGGSN